jgi:hypothetical protein
MKTCRIRVVQFNTPPNAACARSPTKCVGAVVVGRSPALPRTQCGASVAVRVFEQFAWLEVGSVKAAFSRPTWWLTGEAVSKPTSGYPAETAAQRPAGRTQAVGRQ